MLHTDRLVKLIDAFCDELTRNCPEQAENESSGSPSVKSKQLLRDVIIAAQISAKTILNVDITEVLFFLDKNTVESRR
jgi:hypothetical protein